MGNKVKYVTGALTILHEVTTGEVLTYMHLKKKGFLAADAEC